MNLSGKLFLPVGGTKFSAIVLLHSASSNVKAHRATSQYYGRRFAENGGKAFLSELMLLHEANFSMEEILQIATINGA